MPFLDGPICSINVLGTRLVIINDPDVAVDLLDKRAKNTSDRPSFHMADRMSHTPEMNAEY